ncbi:MAG: hypothetical protein LM523_00650 [Candidatus Contendobacter sp.]|nr:hypothetical protein [Candidatus Contendobacter sp.]
MTDQEQKSRPELTETLGAEERRAFLRGLGKWSQAVIGVAALGSGLIHSNPAEAWVAARGVGGSAAVGGRGGWVNRYGGGGGWANRVGGGGWINGGGGGGWLNGGGGSAGWVNRYGGGGSWINR